jgi:group I intron endonuclease
MYINRALLKHGHSNFSLTILEYCEPDKCLEREDYYFKLLKPKYNILKVSGSPARSGFKLSDKHKENISLGKKGISSNAFDQPNSQKISETDLYTNISTSYSAIKVAGKAININYRYLYNYFFLNQEKPLLERYILKKLEVPNKIP